MITDGRWALWTAITGSLRTCFPDRAHEVSGALEDWLEPGPWSLEFKPSEKSSRVFSASARDRLRAEIRRAIHETEPEKLDERLHDLDRWILKSFAVVLCARIGQRRLMSADGFKESLKDWERQASELQITVPDLWSSGSEADALDLARRVASELGAETSPKQIDLAAVRTVAREIVHGHVTPRAGATRLTALGADSDEVDPRRLLLFPPNHLDSATLELAQRILGRAARLQLP